MTAGMTSSIMNACFLLYLAAAAMLDIKKRALPVVLIGAGFVTGGAAQLLFGTLTLPEIFAGCIPGGLMLLLALLTKEAVGYGDGAMLISTGAFLGLAYNLLLLAAALLLAALTGIVLLAAKKIRRKESVPFIPFLLAGEVFLLAAGLSG